MQIFARLFFYAYICIIKQTQNHSLTKKLQAMKNLKELKAKQLFAEISKLGTFKPVTGAINGYPEPELGIFLMPNDRESFETLKEFLGNEIETIHYRDGWTFAELQGYNYDGFIKIDSSDFGDNYDIIKIENDKDIDLVALDYFDFIEDKNEARESAGELKQDLKVGLNIMYHGEFQGCLDLKPISFSNDTHNYKIGFFFSNEDKFEKKIIKHHYNK